MHGTIRIVAFIRQTAVIDQLLTHLRTRAAAEARPGATVRNNRIVPEPHLVAPAFAEGVRYARNVDNVMLSLADAGAVALPERDP